MTGSGSAGGSPAGRSRLSAVERKAQLTEIGLELLRDRPEAVWEALGSHLADDHELGGRLGPVLVSRFTVEAVALRGSWAEALRQTTAELAEHQDATALRLWLAD